MPTSNELTERDNDKDALEDFLDQECLRKRQIFLFGEITLHLAKKITQQLLYLRQNKKEQICININSPGGSVGDGLAILDVIELCKKDFDVSVVGMGECCSMGAILLSSGTKGKRFATKNTTIMFHPVQYELSYDYASKQESYTKYTKEQLVLMNKLVCKYIGKKEKDWEQKIEDGLWLSADEALKLKIIDGII